MRSQIYILNLVVGELRIFKIIRTQIFGFQTFKYQEARLGRTKIHNIGHKTECHDIEVVVSADEGKHIVKHAAKLIYNAYTAQILILVPRGLLIINHDYLLAVATFAHIVVVKHYYINPCTGEGLILFIITACVGDNEQVGFNSVQHLIHNLSIVKTVNLTCVQNVNNLWRAVYPVSIFLLHPNVVD